MKKAFITILLSFFVANAMAQIEMFDRSVQKKEETKALPYDSLRNITTQKYGNGNNCSYTYHHLIGQTLLYCGDPYSYHSDIGFVKGWYYQVDNVLPNNDGFQLTEIVSGEKVEERDLYTHYNYKWVVVGHYEKIESLYLNKEFVYVGMKDVIVQYEWKKANGLINLETDTVTRVIPEGSVWTCVSVQVKPRNKDDGMYLDERSPIVLVFDNPIYGKHYCYLENDMGSPYKSFLDEKKPLVCGRFQLKSDYDKMKQYTAKRKADLTKKYGASNAKLIVEGKVRIGMTKAMCEEAWGSPDRINKTVGSWGTHEQWVYGNSYLYFEGNKLTAIQN